MSGLLVFDHVQCLFMPGTTLQYFIGGRQERADVVMVIQLIGAAFLGVVPWTLALQVRSSVLQF